MALEGTYLGMNVRIDDLDRDHQTFYKFCGEGELRLQQCSSCRLMRAPPTVTCPFCTSFEATWVPVTGRGTLYSYGEVHHAIMPAFRQFTPYLLLLVELDEQRNVPAEHDGLRMHGNLATADGDLAPPDLVARVGIGSRLRVVFKGLGDGLALPLWTIDDTVEQPTSVWRYPDS